MNCSLGGRNRLILEDQLPIPVTRRHRIQGEEDVENRWVFLRQQRSRRLLHWCNLKPIELSRDLTPELQPQLLIQRAYAGETDSYPAAGSPADSEKVSQLTSIATYSALKPTSKASSELRSI